MYASLDREVHGLEVIRIRSPVQFGTAFALTEVWALRVLLFSILLRYEQQHLDRQTAAETALGRIRITAKICSSTITSGSSSCCSCS